MVKFHTIHYYNWTLMNDFLILIFFVRYPFLITIAANNQNRKFCPLVTMDIFLFF
jgi:hypothetical protein